MSAQIYSNEAVMVSLPLEEFLMVAGFHVPSEWEATNGSHSVVIEVSPKSSNDYSRKLVPASYVNNVR